MDRRRRSWSEQRFLVVDCETTSANGRRARPLSVAWVPIDGGRLRLAGAGYSLVRHTEPVPPEGMAIHRLRPGELAGAPSAEAVAEGVREALEGRLLVAHGAWLVRAVLRRIGVRAGSRQIVDTLQLVRARQRRTSGPEATDYSMAAASSRLGLPVRRSHHAFGDALTTGTLFLALATWFADRTAPTLAELMRLGRMR
ncbi:MAG: 3'-5' exonuclease [Egibacteraceae bacterium]